MFYSKKFRDSPFSVFRFYCLYLNVFVFQWVCFSFFIILMCCLCSWARCYYLGKKPVNTYGWRCVFPLMWSKLMYFIVFCYFCIYTNKNEREQIFNPIKGPGARFVYHNKVDLRGACGKHSKHFGKHFGWKIKLLLLPDLTKKSMIFQN